jgi:hypothetical protein
MSPRWRSFWFFVLAIGFVILIDRISIHAKIPKTQPSAAQAAKKSEKKPTPPSTSAPTIRTQLVPLYPNGDLFVRKIKKEKAKKKAKPKPKAKKPGKVAAAKKRKPLPLPTPNRDGDRPILEVGYDEIGFSLYLDAIERVGRFFVLLKTEKGPRLGPEVSLNNGVLSTHKSDLSILATDRPHLVSDPKIQERLAAIELPLGAIDDSVVLMFTKPFDTLLWDTISESLRKHGFSLKHTRLISGAYINGNSGVFLRLDKAFIKNRKWNVPLKRRMRVSLL